jgi:chorismate mutase
MSTPLEQIRQQIARQDAEVVSRLAQRAVCGVAPAGFYPVGWSVPIFRRLAKEAAFPPALESFQPRIEAGFTRSVLPILIPDATVGATAEVDDTRRAADADAITAIAIRLGLSLQVAACKFAGRDTRLRAAAEAGDAAGIEALITFPSVEQLVLLRVRSCAAEHIRACNLPSPLADRLPAAMDAIYSDWLIPLSRAIQATWLIQAATREP